MENNVPTPTYTPTQKEEYQAKRTELFNLTVKLKPIADAEGVKVNALIIAHYANTLGCAPSDLRTFWTWKEQGFKVKKGEKGFPIWSRPKDIIQTEKTGHEVNDDTKFFGLAYMFHKGQVENAKQEDENGAN